VASKSELGIWYRIDGATCDCLDFQYLRACRHLVAVAQRPVEPEPEQMVIEWSDQYAAWLVIWRGFIHGGCHYQRIEADRHAPELREDLDGVDWLARHQTGVWVADGQLSLPLAKGARS
jgi:hypothetical protein